MRGRGFALGVRGHGSGEGERTGEDGGDLAKAQVLPLPRKTSD